MLSFNLSLKAQQGNIWYFGDKAGLDFGSQITGDPSPLNNSAMIADEGCSSISDDNGNLLLYSNGVNVYNRQHQIMMNGDNIGGHISAFQSCLIVQHPGNKNFFYIFTADAYENSFANGYRYSTVDITGDNGKGVVTTKNNLLSLSGTERITACRHANGSDVWIITSERNSNIFNSWLISCNGLQSTPVVSQAGDVLDQYQTISVGVLKCSPDGKQICQTHFPDFDIPISGSVFNFIQLFDFDSGTGKLQNAKKVVTPGKHFISCEYSPNSSYLYLSSLQGVSQLKCKLADVAQIANSLVTISNSESIYGMQLGPDEKIYLSSPGITIDVIDNPDEEGILCNYKTDKIRLTGAAKLGLPNCINDIPYDPYNNFSYAVVDSCNGVIQFNGIAAAQGNISWHWDFGGGIFSGIQNPIHTFGNIKQTIIVRLTISYLLNCQTVNKTIEKRIAFWGTGSKPEFRYYGGCDSGYMRFEIINPIDTNAVRKYIWYFDDGTTSTELAPKHIYNQPGIYNVKLKIKSGTPCLEDSVTTPVSMGTLSGAVTITPDQTIFADQKVQLYASGPGSHYEWIPSTGLDNPHLSSPKASPSKTTTYKVIISNAIGCSTEKSVKITVVELDDIYVPTGFTPNNDGKNDLLIPLMATKYTLKEFSVFNRWGQKVFTTAATGEGWNGKQKGVVSDSGVYIWILKATDETGKLIEKKGSVALIQ